MRFPFLQTSFFLGAIALVACPASLLAQLNRPDLPDPPPLPDNLAHNKPMNPPPGLPDPSELIEQLRQLEELLSLPPEKLEKLRQTIEFIERMSVEEREAMKIRLSQVTRMTNTLRDEIRKLTKLIPNVSHSDLSQFWLAASEEERAEMRAQMAPLSPPQQTDFLTRKIESFVNRRTEIFDKMKDSLEAKKRALSPSVEPAP